MRYGRTSIIHFLSKLVMSFSGFIATVVLTRTLGQEQYGTYVVVLSVLSWVVIGGNSGSHRRFGSESAKQTVEITSFLGRWHKSACTQ